MQRFATEPNSVDKQPIFLALGGGIDIETNGLVAQIIFVSEIYINVFFKE